jgi:hypothetical protein
MNLITLAIIFSIFFYFNYIFMVETPLYLYWKKKYDEAQNVLHTISTCNNRNAFRY